MKYAVLLVTWLALAVIANAQQFTKAEKIDEFGAMSCDNFDEHAERLFSELHDNPRFEGYFVLKGRKDVLVGKLFWEEQIHRAIAIRRPDAPVKIVRGPEEGDFRVEIWVVPSGASVPDFHETKWDFHVPAGTKPFMLSSELGEECGLPARAALINEYFAANPKMYLSVVVYRRTASQLKHSVAETLQSLQGVPTARIRFRHKRLPLGYSFPIRDYWLVPSRK